MAKNQDDKIPDTNSPVGDHSTADLKNELQIDASLFPVDRYKPIKKLGHGALGSVYLCNDVNLQKKVAVKCLHFSTGDHVISFQQEARIASRLNHDNVIKLLDFGTSASGQPFMVMEYFDGRSLQEIIAKHGKLSASPATEIFLQMCSALNYLHSHSVFHRDLKPSNILVNFTNKDLPSIKLIDFGLSKAIIQDSSDIEVQGKTIVGTPAYMSPDQVDGNIFDASSEIYSFGCVLYEMFSGRPPFVGETAIEILNKQANEKPLPLEVAAPEASPRICRIVNKCLKKNRAERYHSIAEIIDDWNEPQLIDSTVDATTETTQTNKKQFRLTTILLLTLIGLLCLFGTILTILQSMPVQSSSTIRFESLPHRNRNSEPEDASFNLSDLSSKNSKARSLLEPKTIDSGARLPDELSIASAAQTDKILNSKADDRDRVILRFVCDDHNVKKLLHRKSLKTLDLSEGSVTDGAFQELSTLPNLSCLKLNRTGVKTLKGIGDLKNLEQLELKNTAVSDESLSQLKALDKLTMLSLSGTYISDAGIKNLIAVHSLRDLYLTSTLVTPAVADWLVKLPLVRISLSRTAIDGEAVRKICKIPSLSFVDITGCEKVSSAERSMLENDFPWIAFEPNVSRLTELRNRADRLVKKGKYRGALADFQRCRAILEKRFGKDSGELVQINVNIGSTAAAVKRFDIAKEALETSLQICEKGENSTSEMLSVVDHLSMVYLRTNLDKLVPTVIRAIKLAEQANSSPTNISERYLQLGDILRLKKQHKEAMAAFQKSMAIVEKFKGKDARDLGPIFIHTGECLREQQRFNDATTYYQKGLAILNEGDPRAAEKREMGIAYVGLASFSLLNRNFPEALKYNDRALASFQPIDRDALKTVHYQRGHILSQLGRAKEAQAERATASSL